jgi:hypothetical protein
LFLYWWILRLLSILAGSLEAEGVPRLSQGYLSWNKPVSGHYEGRYTEGEWIDSYYAICPTLSINTWKQCKRWKQWNAFHWSTFIYIYKLTEFKRIREEFQYFWCLIFIFYGQMEIDNVDDFDNFVTSFGKLFWIQSKNLITLSMVPSQNIRCQILHSNSHQIIFCKNILELPA